MPGSPTIQPNQLPPIATSIPSAAPTFTPTVPTVTTISPPMQSPTVTLTPSLVPLSPPPGSSFKYDEGVPPEHRAMIEYGVAIASAYWGDAGKFTVYAYTNQDTLVEAYSQHLKLNLTNALREQKRSAGSEAVPEGIFLQVDPSSLSASPGLWLRVVAHEYFHVLQYSRAKTKPEPISVSIPPDQIKPIGPVWLTEGGANYAAAKVLAKYELFKYDDARVQSVKAVMNAPASLSSAETFVGAAKTAGYNNGFLATEFLTKQYGEKSILRFYEGIGEGLTWQAAFQKAFSISIVEFYRTYDAYAQAQGWLYDAAAGVCFPSPPPDPSRLTITCLGKFVPGGNPIRPGFVPYTFQVTAFNLATLITGMSPSQRDLVVKRPLDAVWGISGTEFLVVYLKPDAPSGVYEAGLELSDGRKATTTFRHEKQTESTPTPAGSISIRFERRLLPGSLPNFPFDRIYYTFLVSGFALRSFAFEELENIVIRPPDTTLGRVDEDILVITMRPDAPTGPYTVIIQLPDGRRAEAEFVHSR